jgi:hypothetical protein
MGTAVERMQELERLLAELEPPPPRRGGWRRRSGGERLGLMVPGQGGDGEAQ